MFQALYVLFVIVHLCWAKCSWDSCFNYSKDPNIINVHLVCHSHDDMGWLKTVDDYFTGTKSIVNVGVEYIYNSVIDELSKDKNKKFSFAEVGFLTRWLEGRPKNDSRVILLKELVSNGQVEFIGGGWTQNDEAAAHYIDIIGQYSLGAAHLADNFGNCVPPRTAWQVDPFGHSREHANIAALFGYEGLIHGRIHHQDLDNRIKNKALDYVWSGSDDYNTHLLTTAFYLNLYYPPAGFCFDIRCNDEPIVDDEKLEGYNVIKKRDDFIEYVKKQAQSIQHNHVLITLGGDFAYSAANIPFTSNDRLIKAVNAITNETNIQLFYSTPSCYHRAIKDQINKFPQKKDDHFPFADKNHSYWSGYFTSKPEHKRMIRQLSNLLQTVKSFGAFAQLDDKNSSEAVEVAQRALSLSQHHDAVTGTAKEAVTQDYERRIRKGAEGIKKVFSKAVAKLNNLSEVNMQFCSQMDSCELLKNDSIRLLTIFNANSHPTSKMIHLPVHSTASVHDENLEVMDFEISKSFYTLESLSNAPYQLSFKTELPAFGFKNVVIRKSKSSRKRLLKSQIPLQLTQAVVLENPKIKLEFDSDGLPVKWTNKDIGKSFEFHQSYKYYYGVGGVKDQQSSGAYIFRPNDTVPLGEFGKPTRVEFIKGTTFQEVRQVFSPWVSQIIRLDQKSEHVEFQFIVGPIPKEAKDPVAKEIISRFNVTEIKSAGTFQTDSNGRQMMDRKLNYSPTFQRDNYEPIASNFYPITSTILIRDRAHQMTISTDRSQGGGSFGDGNIDLMIHRRCFHDDGYGVEENLDEPGRDGRGLIVNGSHLVKIGYISYDFRQKANEIYNEPILAFTPIENIKTFSDNQLKSFNGLISTLPQQVKILSLEMLSKGKVLLRLENFYQVKDGLGSAQVNLNNLFATLKINKVNEVSLGNTHKIAEMSLIEAQNINLRPMEIRTFELAVESL